MKLEVAGPFVHSPLQYIKSFFSRNIIHSIQAMSEWVRERVLSEDKAHSTGLTMSDPDILVPNKAWHAKLSSHA